MIKEILDEASNKERAKAAMDSMFGDPLAYLDELTDMINKAKKSKDHKKLDAIAKDLSKIKK